MKNQKSKRSALSKTVNAMWKKSTIDDLQKQLESYQKALETKMLKRLCDKFDLATLQQKHIFANVDQRMQCIIQSLASGNTRLVDLVSREAKNTRVHVTKEEQETRAHVVQEGEETRRNMAKEAKAIRTNTADEFALLKIAQADDIHRKAVMDSLFFPDIHARQESIREAHKNTFQWIFETSTQQIRPWSNFAEWLKHGQGIYWISGKAGSGKSTLMNYVKAEERTRDSLKTWAGHRELLIPTFFFWNVGSALQKCTRGLLRSLLYQILEQRPSLTSMAAQSPIPTWTDSRLLKTLLNIIHQNVNDDAICFFIDGLDEFDGDQQHLIDLINDVERSSNVKICVSSRPLQVLQISFSSSPRLKLEDLTRDDISSLVNDKLRSTSAAELANSLTDRADGVFLWVDLAVKDLLRGVVNEDSYAELRHRLDILPQEIEDLYLHMLNQVNTIYRESARHFLRLMLQHTRLSQNFAGQMSLLKFALATYDGIDVIIASTSREPYLENLVSLCRKLEMQIAIRCAGLLELSVPPLEGSITSNHQSAAYDELVHLGEHSKVSFIHVSAYEFLIKDEKAIAFLNSSDILNAYAGRQLFKAEIAVLRLLPRLSGVRQYKTQILKLVALAVEVSRVMPDSVEMLLDMMDLFFVEVENECHETDFRSSHNFNCWFVDKGREYLGALIPARLAYAKGPHGSQVPISIMFAAWNGIFEYVLKKLDQFPQAQAIEAASRMLIFVLKSSRITTEDTIHGAKVLFSRGANGGMVFEVPLEHSTIHHASDEDTYSVTGWKAFLDTICFATTRDGEYARNQLKVCSSIADAFLNQSIDPSVVGEVALYVERYRDRPYVQFGSTWDDLCTILGLSELYHHAVVVSISPALILDVLPGSLANKLPSELRRIRTRKVTQVWKKDSKRFYDISETQAEYLTEAFGSWLIAQDVQSTKNTLYTRLREVFDELDPPPDDESTGLDIAPDL